MNRKPKRSIQFQLTASYTSLLALTFLLIGIGVWFALNRSIEDTADKELRSRLADVRSYFDSFTADDLTHLEEEFREESLLGQSAANIRIADANGRWLFRTPGTERWPEASIDLRGLPKDGKVITLHAQREQIRVLTAPVRLGVAQIGLPIDEFEEVRNGFLFLLILGSPIVLLLAWVGGYWMSGRALRPVDEISTAAANISADSLSNRLPRSGLGDELDRLSDVLNGMLARLEAAFRRVTEFTADASHELRTPVAVIQTTAELMQTQPRAVEEHVRAWNRVRWETERTSRLIGDLLTLARADAGKRDFELEPIMLDQVVHSAVEEMRVLIEAKGLCLKVAVRGSCHVKGDMEGLHRAIGVLLDNSMKFTTAPGEISVDMKCGEQAEVRVSDTGVGISEADLPLIFERFYRVAKDRSRQTGGAGLGLAIARWIVERHSGEIRAQSELGKGSVFTIFLPTI